VTTLRSTRPVNTSRLPVPLTIALALLSFVGPMGVDMYLPAFPRLAAEFGVDPAGVQLTLTAFLVGFALGQLLLGPLSDRYGRRRPILAGAALCTAATAACALVPSVEWLVVARFLAGFGGAAGLVIGRAVILDTVDETAAARLFGILMALGGIAPIIAPLVGGIVSDNVGWRAVFWTLAAGSALNFLVALVAVPESLPPERRTGGGSNGTASLLRSVLTNRSYLGYTFVLGFGFAALFCYIAASPFLLQHVLGLTVGESSVVFATGALTTTLSSAVNARLVGRVSPERLLRVGLATMLAAAVGLLAATLAGLTERAIPLGGLFVFFLGLGMILGNATALALRCVPTAAGTGSAVLGTLQNVLGALVAPLMGLGGRDVGVPLFLGMTLCVGLASLSLRLTRTDAVIRPGA